MCFKWLFCAGVYCTVCSQVNISWLSFPFSVCHALWPQLICLETKQVHFTCPYSVCQVYYITQSVSLMALQSVQHMTTSIFRPIIWWKKHLIDLLHNQKFLLVCYLSVWGSCRMISRENKQHYKSRLYQMLIWWNITSSSIIKLSSQ